MSSDQQSGVVIRASNNLFDVCPLSSCDTCLQERSMVQCRIKGKRLNITEECKPILVAGDHVSYSVNSDGSGGITERQPRNSFFQRWNLKARTTQVLAANIDMLVFVFSVAKPQTSLHMLDSACAAAVLEGLDIVIAVNKSDLGISDECYGQISYYKSLGYQTYHMSAMQNVGVEAFHQAITGKTSVFVGASGTGKSTLLNLLCPDAQRETAPISKKYKSGRHTTSQSSMFLSTSNARIIDTPGINSFELFCYDKSEIRDGFSEFLQYADRCAYTSCLHLHEPSCEVLSQLEQEEIPLWRYTNYRRILEHWEMHKAVLDRAI